MRCLLIQGGFGAGGTEKVVALLARHRASLGDEVHVAGLTRPSEGSFFAYPPEVALHVAQPDGERAQKGAQLVRFRQIYRLLRDLRPDVVISFLTKVNTLTVLAATGTQVPVIISERNNPAAQPSSAIWGPLNSFAMKRASAIVMQTQRICDELPSSLSRKSIVVPNPCAPIGDVRTGPPQGEGVHFVAVGRLDPQKGFDLLLRAFAACWRADQNLKLTIFGEGSQRGDLERLSVALGVNDAVRLPGVTTSPGAWIEAGDIMVLSSRYEGFPNVVAEATVSGLPVIAFDCPYGPRELISDGRNGLLIPEGDVSALADAMSRLAADATLRQSMRTAASLNRARLSEDAVMQLWDRTIDATVQKQNVLATRTA
ncbi:MAG: glycosyltransferase family 4 protein [Pseudomonadota bacterium]